MKRCWTLFSRGGNSPLDASARRGTIVATGKAPPYVPAFGGAIRSIALAAHGLAALSGKGRAMKAGSILATVVFMPAAVGTTMAESRHILEDLGTLPGLWDKKARYA